MKGYKLTSKTPRLQDYVGNPVNLYFLVCEGLDEDAYVFNRFIGCHSYRDSDGRHKGLMYRSNVEPLPKYKYYNTRYNRSLKSKKHKCKNTLRSQIARKCYEY